MTLEHQQFSRVLELSGLNENDDILHTEVSDAHIQKIAEAHCREWQNLPVHLSMKNTRTVAKDIKKNISGVKEQTEEFFDVWKTKKGNDATYYALINALLHIQQRADAEFVCGLLKEAAADGPQGNRRLGDNEAFSCNQKLLSLFL